MVRRGRTKSTDMTCTPYTHRDYHRKLHLREFDYGKLNAPFGMDGDDTRLTSVATEVTEVMKPKEVGWREGNECGVGLSGCTTSRESAGNRTHRELDIKEDSV